MAGLSDKQEQDARRAAKTRWAKARQDFDGEWREVPSLPGYYASPDGRVRSKHKVLAAHAIKSGHLMVAPSVNGKQAPAPVHRMVCEAFHGPCPSGMECRHMNGDPADNRADNLVWGTRLDNQRDRLRHGTCNTGERNGRQGGASVSHCKGKQVRIKHVMRVSRRVGFDAALPRKRKEKAPRREPRGLG